MSVRGPILCALALLWTAGDLETSHVDGGFGGSVAALVACGVGLVVGDGVEGDEEQQVARQDDAAGNGGELLASAATRVGDPGPVGAGEVGVGREVDEA